jgi:hypothetical protein
MASSQDRLEDTSEVLDPDDLEERRRLTQTEIDRLDPGVPVERDSRVIDPLDAFERDELREGETDDPDVATEEGIPWVPPIDPPVVATPWSGDPVVAAGAGISALDEDYDESGELLSEEGDINDRIREALRADSSTSRLADSLLIAVVGSTAVIRGVVEDLDDGDSIVEVVSRVDGIEDVRDETVFEGL